jgi:hypothetical protein
MNTIQFFLLLNTLFIATNILGMNKNLESSQERKQTNTDKQPQQKTTPIEIMASSKKTMPLQSSSPYSGNTPDWLTLHYKEEILKHSNDTLPK